jgi:hypothetical protein
MSPHLDARNHGRANVVARPAVSAGHRVREELHGPRRCCLNCLSGTSENETRTRNDAIGKRRE